MDFKPTNEVVIPFRKKKIIKSLFMGLVMIVASVAICFLPEGATPFPRWSLRILGVFGAAFFALVFLVYVSQLFNRRPGLVIDRQGIIDHTTYAGVGRVSWGDIRGLRISMVRKVAFLVIDVYEPRQFIDRGNAVQRFLKVSNARMVGSPISLATTSLDANLEGLVGTIEHFRAEAGVADRG